MSRSHRSSPWRLLPGVRRVVISTAAWVVWAAIPSAAAAQILQPVADATVPRKGDLRIDVSASFLSWHEQFALDSSLPGVSDGDREPETVDYDGAVAGRLSPGLQPFVADLNSDAAALGFDPVSVDDLDMGSLTYGTIDYDVRRLPLTLELGVLDWLALDIGIPLVKTDVEPAFQWDSVSANLALAAQATGDPSTFFGQFSSAEVQLQSLIDSGSLSPGDQATAEALLANSSAFSTALENRVTRAGLLPTLPTTSGQQITGNYAGLSAGYASFGLALPAFALPATATTPDFDGYFEGTPMQGTALRESERGWALGELEVGLRVQVLDSFNYPAARDSTQAVPAVPDSAAIPAVADDSAAAESASITAAAAPRKRRWLGLRTTVGGLFRTPLSAADRSPYIVSNDYLGLPVGNGAPTVELALYQDIELGSKFVVVSSLRYGLQMSDQLTLRVARPDRPYSVSTQEAELNRDLGDYLLVRVEPRFRLNEVISVGAQYSYWHKGEDSYALTGSGQVPSARPLEVETLQTRTRLGVGFYYQTISLHRAGRAKVPIELAIVFETAISGSGGQTPASKMVNAGLRVPVKLF